MKRGLSWLIAMPLVVAGSQLAHAAAYVFAMPDAHERAHVLETTGHGYLGQAPLAGALIGATLVVAFTLHVREGARGRAPGYIRVWPFALLPLLTFVLQEHLERLIHTGAFPLAAGLEPSFAFGLLLQVPFGLLAYAAASLLLRSSHRLAWMLRRRQPPKCRPFLPLVLRPRVASSPRGTVLAAGIRSRGPPISR